MNDEHNAANRAAENIAQRQVDQLALTPAAAIGTAACQVWEDNRDEIEAMFPTLIEEIGSERFRVDELERALRIFERVLQDQRGYLLNLVGAFFEVYAEDARRWLRPELCEKLEIHGHAEDAS